MVKEIPIYAVEQHGIELYQTTSLRNCFRFIGTQIKGMPFGCLNVTVAQAVRNGYAIVRY